MPAKTVIMLSRAFCIYAVVGLIHAMWKSIEGLVLPMEHHGTKEILCSVRWISGCGSTYLT